MPEQVTVSRKDPGVFATAAIVGVDVVPSIPMLPPLVSLGSADALIGVTDSRAAIKPIAAATADLRRVPVELSTVIPIPLQLHCFDATEITDVPCRTPESAKSNKCSSSEASRDGLTIRKPRNAQTRLIEPTAVLRFRNLLRVLDLHQQHKRIPGLDRRRCWGVFPIRESGWDDHDPAAMNLHPHDALFPAL